MDKIIAHRGGALRAPENTLPAFEWAASIGCKWMELDVRLAACGTPIVIHDETLDRTTTGTGATRNLSFEQIQQADAGAPFGSEFAGTSVPSLEQTLCLLRSLGCGLNLELKTDGEDLPALVRQTLACCQAMGFGKADLLVSSFDHDALTLVRQSEADLPIGILYWQDAPDWEHKAKALKASTLHMDYKSFAPSLIKQAKEAGLGTFSYTVNDVDKARALLSNGLDGVITDDPELLMQSLA